MTYSKEDVEFHSEGFYGPQRPAVNVKVYESVEEGWRTFKDCMADEDLGNYSLEWVDESGHYDEFFWFACECGWEMIEDNAKEIFGTGTQVYSAGRSGGWAIVDNLPPFESWDAPYLMKWRKFEKWAKLVAADTPFRVIDSIYHNVYYPDREDAKNYAFGEASCE